MAQQKQEAVEAQAWGRDKRLMYGRNKANDEESDTSDDADEL